MLKKNNSTPLYNQLVDVLIEHIKTNLDIDEKMLSEREICLKYDVSRTTVRAALNELEEMGYIFKRHGKGTFVSGLWKEMQNLSEAYSFTEQMKQLGKTPHSQVISLEYIVANQDLAKNVGIQEGEHVYKMKRLRSADGMPMMYETTFIPAYLFPDLTISKLESMPLYELYPQVYNQDIKYADEEFYASVLQAKESEQLGLPAGSACLRIRRTTYSQENKIVEYTLSVARGDQFVYKIRHSKK
ncbi:GntR family transcriptional regulator [uncultured Trichococcus sp.]|uniref:GntR family transcriptional regulator n=1 Tax=uncultured Trichococcus sp. TaxID=189665 RepID=UPI0029C94F7A|nr:GntR family transcriptional regulator [uncultured Trichococcus sp.]